MKLTGGIWWEELPADTKPPATEGRWTATRVVDESARLAGLWRVSAYAYTMWLTVHFAVESRSGAVHGALLEGRVK
eukprot:s959_g3.t1